LPIQGGQNLRYPLGKSGGSLRWNSSLSASGRVKGLGLSGNFLVEFQFEVGELKNWLALYVAEFPEDAIRVLAEMQAEAFILLAKLRPDAKESP